MKLKVITLLLVLVCSISFAIDGVSSGSGESLKLKMTKALARNLVSVAKTNQLMALVGTNHIRAGVQVVRLRQHFLKEIDGCTNQVQIAGLTNRLMSVGIALPKPAATDE